MEFYLKNIKFEILFWNLKINNKFNNLLDYEFISILLKHLINVNCID